MVDISKVTSGFDVEFLMGEDYIRYLLLAALETGSIPWWSESQGFNDAGDPHHIATIIHPPSELQDRRLYDVNPEFEGREHPFQDVIATVYSRQDTEFQVTIQPDDASGVDIVVRVFPSVVDLRSTPPGALIENRLSIDLHIGLDIVSETRADGLLGNIGLQLAVIDVSGQLVEAATSLGNDRKTILADMKRQIDRRVPFALSGGGALQRVVTHKFLDETEGARAIGVFVNLALRTGPASTDLVPDRGDATLAQNFLNAQATMAFAFTADLYGRLADDFKWKLAVEKSDATGQFHFPLMDGSQQVGTIKGIAVYAERVVAQGQPAHFTNVLVIDIHGEYAIDNFVDPDFHLRIRLVPKLGANGLLDFDIDFDLSFSALTQILTVFFTVALSFVLPKLGLSLLFLSMLTFKIIERVGESMAGAAIQAELDRSSFLDTLPHKLLVEQRRWDPLYSTLHRVEIGETNQRVDDAGFAFDAARLFVGKKTVPLTNMVIRSETRDAAGVIDGLVYRADGIGPVLDTDLIGVFAAADRMPRGDLLPPEGDVENHRVRLSFDQIGARTAASDRHLTGIDYRPRKVEVKNNQILHILALSDIELGEISQLSRDRLRREIRRDRGAALRTQAIVALTTELGRAPDEAEITARLNALIDREVDVAFPSRLERELDVRMAFNLEPHEFAALQRQRKLLVLGRNHLVIRTMRRSGGDRVTYYRDYERPFEPNTDKRDNLMSLPRYRSG